MAYEPEPRITDQKHRLYEEYWGNFKSIKQIAEENDLYPRLIRDSMEEFGIPKRKRGTYDSNNTVSPFTGFYKNDATTSSEEETSHFDEDFEETITPNWQRIAEKDPAVGDAATFKD